MGKEKALKGVDTSNFDWRGLHPDFGSPLHAVLFGKIRDDTGTESDESTANGGDGFGDLIGDDVAEKQSRLLLLRLAMEKGADPNATAPTSCDVQKFWFLEKRGQRKETKSIVFAGKSAFQCLLAAERAIKMTDAADWKEDLEVIDEAIEILSRAGNRAASVSVAEGVVELWESILCDNEFADVTICVGSASDEADDDERSEERTDDLEFIPVHSVVLCNSSPVLRAMLSTTGMREGARKLIRVKDCNATALRLLLALIYTGTIGTCDTEPTPELLLAALDLAHRWQVMHIVQMIATALQRHVSLDCFESILDAALRFELQALLSACRAFASSHAGALRLRMGNASVPTLTSPTVRAEVARILGDTPGAASSCEILPNPRKRRRSVL